MAARSHRSERSLGQQTQEGCSHSSAVRRMTDLDPERSAGGSQLEGQVHFVSDGDAVLAHGRTMVKGFKVIVALSGLLICSAEAVSHCQHIRSHPVIQHRWRCRFAPEPSRVGQADCSHPAAARKLPTAD